MMSVIVDENGMDPFSSDRGDTGMESSGNGLFKGVNNLRGRESVIAVEVVEHAKFNDSWCGLMARMKVFEVTTLFIISVNAVVIGYDVDYSARWGKPDNLYDGPLGFIFMENLFCTYFFLEVVIIRFLGFKTTWLAITDLWYVFDAVLVLVMVAETWIMPLADGGGSLFAQFSILRLLRLLRITRMARLMRSVPELMTLVKGMIAAMRSVGFVAILQLLVIYVFAILFTAEYHQGVRSDEDVMEMMESEDSEEANAGVMHSLFGSMGKSMFSLFIMGTILDDVTLCTDAIRRTASPVYLLAFLLFIVISSFTMLNMLLGVLVEVVQATAEGEKLNNMEASVREAITKIFKRMDKDQNGMITKDEFLEMGQDMSVQKALSDLDIRPETFERYACLLYRPDPETGMEPSMGFEELLTMLLRLRPGTFINGIDLTTLQIQMLSRRHQMKLQVLGMEQAVEEITGRKLPPSLLAPKSAKGRRDAVAGLSTPKSRAAAGEAYRLSEDAARRLQHTAIGSIVSELQRRLCVGDSFAAGVPLCLTDKSLQARVRAAENFNSTRALVVDPDIPEEWSQEVLTC